MKIAIASPVIINEGESRVGSGNAAAMPVQGMLKHFRSEFVHHIEKKACLHGTVEPKWGRAGARHEPHVVRNMAEAARAAEGVAGVAFAVLIARHGIEAAGRGVVCGGHAGQFEQLRAIARNVGGDVQLGRLAAAMRRGEGISECCGALRR